MHADLQSLISPGAKHQADVAIVPDCVFSDSKPASRSSSFFWSKPGCEEAAFALYAESDALIACRLFNRSENELWAPARSPDERASPSALRVSERESGLPDALDADVTEPALLPEVFASGGGG